MQEIDIGQVVRQSGIAASTLRYDETRGLVQPIDRNGLRRVYATSVLQRLSLIALGRAAGFSLEEIGSMLGDGAMPGIDRPQLLRKADPLERRITRLQALRDGLRHAAWLPSRRPPAMPHLPAPDARRTAPTAPSGR